MSEPLFAPFDLAGVTMRNRFVRSATFDAAGQPDGEVSPAQEAIFGALASGGVGLIVSGITCIDRAGRLSPLQNGAESGGRVHGLARLAAAAHRGGAKAALQLFHGGRESVRFHRGEPLALGPSDPIGGEAGFRAMTAGEVEAAALAFGRAARRAREAGFDAVQLHGAHGYLLSQFLSPLANRRRDRFGGSLENRLRLHRLSLRAVREEAGADFPLLIKLGVADGVDGGLELAEGLKAARLLAGEGLAAVEVSQGLRGPDYGRTEFRTGVDKPGGEAYFLDWAAMVRQQVGIPVIAQGGLRELATCRRALESGAADLIALSRPLIREPGLIARWAAGDQGRARCLSCNLCLERIMRRLPLACAVELKKAAEAAGREP